MQELQDAFGHARRHHQPGKCLLLLFPPTGDSRVLDIDDQRFIILSVDSYLNLTPFPRTTQFVILQLTVLRQNFRGQHGKAYLFASVVNIQQAEATERNMTTGRHIVRDISCRQCKETVGWKYDKAYEASEKYKEGKYILEAELLSAVY